MLRIYLHLTRRCSRVWLVGQLAGPQVVEFEDFWRGLAAKHAEHPVIDLSEVSDVDQHGRDLLRRIQRAGVDIVETMAR